MSRIEHEIEHGRKILDNAEIFWGWGTPAGQERLKRRVKMLVEFGGLKSGAIVLELGCGKGLYTRELEKTGATILPIDISQDLLRAARRETAVSHYVAGDAHRLPFADSRFDAVVGISVLHHLDVDKVLAESMRVLRPGGKFVFSEPNMMNPQILLQKNVPYLKRMLGDSPDETAFWRWQLRRQVGAAGFRCVRCIPFDFLHPSVPARMISIVDNVGRVLENIPVLREIAGSLLITAEK